MSAVATPPAPPAPPPPVEPITIGPARQVDLQTKHGPMRNLPAINRTMTTVEAEQRRQVWQPPNVVHGEFVFYRRAQGNDEVAAWVIRSTNKTFHLIVAAPNYTLAEKTSVAYYDHTEANPELTGDPKAAWNNNGTFRRTEFGMKLANMIAKQDDAASNAVEFSGLMNDLIAAQQQINDLKATELKSLERISLLEKQFLALAEKNSQPKQKAN